MMKTDRTGQKFGKLTIIKDSPNSQILCRCDCGVEELFPRTITKPTYKGRKMCSYCKGGICEVCGERFPSKSGRIAATCSEKCAKIRNSEKEKKRYHSIKHTEEFKNTRASYLTKLRDRLNSDPALLSAFRERARLTLKKCRSSESQIKKEHFNAKKRWQQITSDSALHEQSILYARKQYDTYTDEDYKRIFKRERTHTRKRKSRISIE